MRAIHPLFLMLVTWVVVFLETRFTFLRGLIGVQIDLLPVLMVYVALTAGVGTVVLLAFWGGMLFDSVSANPLGVTTFVLLLLGLGLVWRRDMVLRDEPYARFVLGLIAGAFVPPAVLVVMLSLGANPLIGWGLLWDWVVIALVNGFLTGWAFRFFDQIRSLFHYEVFDPPSYREDREIKRSRT